MRIPLSKPDVGEREVEYVTRALRSGQLSLGPAVEEFEGRFAAYVGTRYAVATNSGTSALHLCVKALGIGCEDEVLTPSFSFPASVNCLLYEHALPAFVDIDPLTLNLDPTEARKVLAREYLWDSAQRCAMNRRSGRILKAILPVHLFGFPCEMGPILDVAREFNLFVIEDACEAIGAEWKGRHVGTFGDAAAFAFYPNKQLTTGEGGMIVTDNAEIASVCRSLRNQGRGEDGEWLLHVRMGYNYRLSDIQCALGLAQLERIDERLSARERLAALYAEELSGIPEIVLPLDPPNGKRSWFVYPVRLRGPAPRALRDVLMASLQERGIASRAYFGAIHRQPYFQQIRLSSKHPLPHTELASESCVALPFFPSMTEEQLNEVCAAVREILREARKTAACGREVARAAAI
ncbi:MAG: DegT/DnrJ/EryC1/StrS family aminotransferase [Candidatus Acidiferrales bacterium]